MRDLISIVNEHYLDDYPNPDRWQPILDEIATRVETMGVRMDLYPMSSNRPIDIMRGNQGWALAWIERENGSKGAGVAAMNALNAEADAWGQIVWLQADDADGLVGYYEALGYRKKGRNKEGFKMARIPDRKKQIHRDPALTNA